MSRSWRSRLRRVRFVTGGHAWGSGGRALGAGGQAWGTGGRALGAGGLALDAGGSLKGRFLVVIDPARFEDAISLFGELIDYYPPTE